MPQLALMFPGHGSQYPGMARDLIQGSARAREILERADDILGYSLSRLMVAEDGDELNRTVHTQPAIFVHSVALLELLRERVPLSPMIAAGHSLGEYSALCAAGVLSFDEALDVIRVRAQGMDEAQPAGTCAMAALMGLTKERALALIEAHRGDEVLEAANFNAPDQVVVSGRLPAVKRILAAAQLERKARAVMLPVSSAFHTGLMEPARDALDKRLASVSLAQGRFPVVANVTGRPYPPGDAGREMMIEQVVRPVLWEDCVRTMLDAGADFFVEVGPGKVLGGLLRRIDRTARSTSISSIEAIETFAEVPS